MSYEHAGTLYRTYRAAVEALALDYLTAQGLNSAVDVLEMCGDQSRDDIAADMIRDGWDVLRYDGEIIDVSATDLHDGILEALNILHGETIA